MDWWLNTVANVLQIIQSFGFLVVAWKWGRAMVKTHSVLFGGLCALLAVSILVSGASFAERVGWWPAQKIDSVSNRHYVNEDVILDYHAYYSCEFENVLFKYGGGPTYLSPDSKIIGKYGFEIASAQASRIVEIMARLGIIGKQSQAIIKTVPSAND